ncbi:MAG: hypothetical protein JJU10_03875 [Idiomarina sp.]|nr:hypothetical protein [Idiomarina sp.]
MTADSDVQNALVISDAETFAVLFERYQGELSPELLEQEYLDVGSDGIAIFTPYRIIDADNLAKQIANNRSTYEKAISMCLPTVRSLSDNAASIVRDVADLIGESETAPAYVVFGGNNSGGTASADGLVIGIEVLCDLVSDQAAFALLFEDFIAHEIVHVYQNRLIHLDRPPTLLEMALVEGVADFIAEKILGRVSSAAVQRSDYGLKHEAELWQEFIADMHGSESGDWLYRQDLGDGRPADLGYWIGKRIAESYYKNASNKKVAVRELVGFSDAQVILDNSQYGKAFD